MAPKPPRNASSASRRPGSRAAMPPCSPPYYRTQNAIRRRRRPGTFSSGGNGYWVRCRNWAARKSWMKSTTTRGGIADAQDTLEDGRYFEYRSFRNACDAGAILLEAARDRGYSAADVAE